MFTSADKAIVAMVLGAVSIINIVWGVDVFGWSVHTEETLGVIVGVLMPILVWLVPNR